MIKFETIRWKNLLSTGNSFTEIDFNRSQNTLIIGTNGAGKSTMLDALCFVLFGKPFRKINKPQLPNSINQKDCVVEIEFSIGQTKYKVIRGIKPNVFEIYCNGVLVDQHAKSLDYQEYLEKSILKMNYKSFTQVVILGSASFIPFMQLSTADRRAIIEDLLDIQIFSSMNSVVKEKMALIKEQYTKNKYAMDLVSEKINLQKQLIEEHKKRNNDDISKLEYEIVGNNEQVQTLSSDIELLQIKINELNEQIQDKATAESKIKKILQLEAKMDSNVNKIINDISFYEENDNCPTCKQSLTIEFKEQQILERKSKKTEIENGIIEINKEFKKMNDRIVEIQSINKQITQYNNESISYNATITSLNKQIVALNKEINTLKNKQDTTEVDNDKLKSLKLELDGLLKDQEEIASNKQYYEFSASLLKDNGIKTKIIKQYLPIMNKFINKYLTAMDFFANFNLNESFEETIKSRHRDDFSYANFSEGEKMRIDLALLLTWRQIAKMKNSTNTNLLILDEVFDSSLDSVGTDEFMKLIHEMGKESNVFVISHKGDQLFDKFHSVIQFQKKNNFSQILI